MAFINVSFKKPKNLTDWTKITTKILTLSENHFEGNVNKFATINSKDLPKVPVWKKKERQKLNIDGGDDEKQLSSKAFKFCSLTSLFENSNQHNLLQ